MEGNQQITSKRQLKLIQAVKANDDSVENSLATTSRNLQIINHQDKDESNNDYTYVGHLEDFFENEMGAYHVGNEVSNASIVRHFCSQMKTDDAFYIVDLSYFVKRYLQWLHYLPRVKPYYAVKCNPNKFIIKTLAHQDIGFDCASAEELDLVLATCPSINCEKKIIYSHPCKPISHIKYFRQHHVQMTVIDNEDELFKIKEHWSDAKVLLRLKITKNGNSMSTKFGANQYQIIKLLKLAKQLNINLVGCSFHVGSQCSDRNLYEQTLQFARKIFDLATTEECGGFKFTILNIGGGFPVQFSEVAEMIQDMIDKLFPEEEGKRD
ncbi:unnamed protein product [Rotaria magnacalcarata]|uniref:Orn/DAP/Arg decarboxylase 2 N-terminal domain-containing protein n=1 Tax=Rotaria magnacalcarata TaxID=392030 RepID=A0A8S2RKZ4_9BILA|nr:unnamed protein product [Rotaria magnacalcarata]